MKKYRAAIVGATGAVGRKLTSLLSNHPYFTLVVLAASARSAGQTYAAALAQKARQEEENAALSFPSKIPPLPQGGFAERNADGFDPVPPPPASIANAIVLDTQADFEKIVSNVDVIFCAINADRNLVRAVEERFARAEVVVVSNNAANRLTPDVPVIIPEINAEHLAVLPAQKRRLGTKRGCIVAKSNCSVLSYLPFLHPLRSFGLKEVSVCTFQAVSGAGKTLSGMPQIRDNVIPYIEGEEEKSESEPLKIWGKIKNGVIVPATQPKISAQCLRVPVSEGHLAAVSVCFENPPEKKEILSAWESFSGEPQRLCLPYAPKRFLHYFSQNDRPQPAMDRETERGMGVCAGRLREDSVFDYKFIGLSHNTVRGAAGGAILLAELLAAKGYLS